MERIDQGFRSHRHDVGSQEEKRRKRKSTQVQGASGCLRQPAKAQSPRISRRRAHARNVRARRTLSRLQADVRREMPRQSTSATV
eukprot:2039144-Pleurochrysis_carterae.AAC.1